ncbi:hypothetical protein GUITHDRAFT_144780 [Guillardia theta CCMP2712]|uniref:Uncharacterized protein n=1 Tax=Guillardia theta (strain CCMP2712) TaxID=905079 RepID=L1INH6_GUITC|nr:hypothetical protein GUITHDRAFT_144780 [Guillardia theta CCMP2712]EKX37647.1 hypothetical protein GUITHDRAFT_144780 [Guillardia theta CCMP2712]|eukprot:XP_005824627.1 hypothetical protein GUITHDRAFT_144780 [Guillardia theta CCMP2712]
MWNLILSTKQPKKTQKKILYRIYHTKTVKPTNQNRKNRAEKECQATLAGQSGDSWQGFTTGGGRRLQASSTGLKKAEALFSGLAGGEAGRETEEGAEKECQATLAGQSGDSWQGFTTGGGRRLQASSTGLKKAEALFSGLAGEEAGRETEEGAEKECQATLAGQSGDSWQGFTTGGGRRLQASSTGLKKAEALFSGLAGEEAGRETEEGAEKECQATLAGQSGDSWQGFTTGGGRRLQASSTGLKKAEALFSGFDCVEEGESQAECMNGYTNGTRDEASPTDRKMFPSPKKSLDSTGPFVVCISSAVERTLVDE